jgi:hypothetical protein
MNISKTFLLFFEILSISLLVANSSNKIVLVKSCDIFMLVVLLALSVKSLILYINYSKEEHEKALNEKQLQEKNTANWKDHYWEWQAKCRENNWSGTFFGKDCPDTSWKKNEKKRGDYQSILDADGI